MLASALLLATQAKTHNVAWQRLVGFYISGGSAD